MGKSARSITKATKKIYDKTVSKGVGNVGTAIFGEGVGKKLEEVSKISSGVVRYSASPDALITDYQDKKKAEADKAKKETALADAEQAKLAEEARKQEAEAAAIAERNKQLADENARQQALLEQSTARQRTSQESALRSRRGRRSTILTGGGVGSGESKKNLIGA